MFYIKVSEGHGSSLPAAARCACTSRPFAQESACQRPAQDQADALQHVEGLAGPGSAWANVPQSLCHSHTCGAGAR